MLRLQFSGLPFDDLHWFNNALSLVVAFIGLLSIFYYSSILFWQFSYPEEFKFQAAEQPKAKPAAVARGNWRWFEDTAAPAPVRKVVSKLKAKLLGVIAQGGEGEGIAMISVDGKKGEIFHVGDELLPGVFLKSVAAYVVQLKRGERIEILEIKRFNVFRGEIPEQSKKEPQPKKSRGKKAPKGAEISKEEFRCILKEKPLKIIEFVNFTRDQRGISIAPKSAEYQSLFSELGLSEGDIIVSANGKNIRDLQIDPKAWQTIINEEKISLKVMRDGIITDIFID